MRRLGRVKTGPGDQVHVGRTGQDWVICRDRTPKEVWGKGALSFLWTHWISGAGEKHAHMLGKQWDVRTWCPGQCRAGEAACGVARAEGH